jgi:hypothetical protein
MQGNNLENVETKQMDGNPDPILCEVKGERARERDMGAMHTVEKWASCCCVAVQLVH